LDPERAVEHALDLVAEGADLIDVGGESTRPGAQPVGEPEEWDRVGPVIERLARTVRVPISIDTLKPGVARAAIRAGASVVNDVGANRSDPAMWEVVAESGAGYVCMHMRGEPRTMQQEPVYADVVEETRQFLADRLERLTEAGVAAEQVVLDVGIGFGKTVEHNLQLLGALQRFTNLDRPLLLGVSRKSFMGGLLGAGVAERLPASLACACWGVGRGVNILRVHDVRATVQAVRMTEALLERMRD
jgi:dihydropteroate synthase